MAAAAHARSPPLLLLLAMAALLAAGGALAGRAPPVPAPVSAGAVFTGPTLDMIKAYMPPEDPQLPVGDQTWGTYNASVLSQLKRPAESLPQPQADASTNTGTPAPSTRSLLQFSGRDALKPGRNISSPACLTSRSTRYALCMQVGHPE